MPTHHASFPVTGFATGSERVSFENPSGSGKKAIMHMPLRTVADQGFAVWKIRRRTELADHDGAAVATVQKNDSADGSPVCEVFYSTAPGQLTFNGSVDWERLTSHDASDGGDDSEEYVAKYLTAANALIVRPGESLTLVLPDGEIEWNIEMMWEEQPV